MKITATTTGLLSILHRLQVSMVALIAYLHVFLCCFFLGLASSSTTLTADDNPQHEFYFTRGIYTDDFGIGDENGGSWSIDYPEADRHFTYLLSRLSGVDSAPDENAVKLTDPELFELPFIYALEVGAMQLDEAEVKSLRNYLLAGGFLFIDDFWGSWAWENLIDQMQLVFPDREITDVPPWHAIFNLVFELGEIKQVPNYRNGIDYARKGITHEEDGTRPHMRAILDDAGRIMVLINWNTDLGDAWEWADHPDYPAQFTTYAAKLGVNVVVYAMTH